MSLSNFVSADILEIHQLMEIENYISFLKDSDWLLFDIDYTLTEPSHPVLQMCTIKQEKKRYSEELAHFTDQQRLLVPVYMVTLFPNQLTDNLILGLIHKLQNEHKQILGFTAIDTSVLPNIGSIPEWRWQELEKLGINFLPIQEKIEFTEFSPYRGTFPLYQDGILYCNTIHSKGAVLSAFIRIAAMKPSKIYFVDDSLDNLKSVEEEMAKLEIPFVGLHYKEQVDSKQISKYDEWRKIWDTIKEKVKELN